MTEQTNSKAPAADTKPKTKTPRKTAQPIRNLRGTVVHLRLRSLSEKDPFRIELKPRGQQGDWTTVPAKLTDDPTLVQAMGVLVEPITLTEAKSFQYGPVGYLGRTDAPQIIRPEDTTISTADNWDGTGRRAPQERNVVHRERGSDMNQADREFGTGMHTVDVPGADHGLHAKLKAEALASGENAVPDGVDLTSRQVRIERVKGQ